MYIFTYVARYETQSAMFLYSTGIVRMVHVWAVQHVTMQAGRGKRGTLIRVRASTVYVTLAHRCLRAHSTAFTLVYASTNVRDVRSLSKAA